MNLLMRQSYSDIKETNRFFRKVTFLICITIFLSTCNYAEAEEPVELYFILENPTSNKNKEFNRTIATFVEQNLRDVENKPEIISRAMKPEDIVARGYHTFEECAKGEKKDYVVTIKLIPHRDDVKTVNIEFTLIDIKNPSRSQTFKPEVVDINLSDQENIKVNINRIIRIIRGRPLKIIFTYCFEHLNIKNEELINLKNDMPKMLTEALKEILKEKKLDTVYEVIAIPVDCNDNKERKRISREHYDYSIAGTLFAKPDGSLKTIELSVYKESRPILGIPPFEPTGEGNVIGKLANFIIEKLPYITKGGK